jgi:hypothetical protein
VRIYGPKKMRSIGEWKKLHNEELNQHQILFGCLNREVGNGRGRRTYGEMTGAYRVLVGKLDRQSRSYDNIKMDLREVGWGMDWIDMAQNGGRWRIRVDAVMNLRFPQNEENF